MIFQWGANSIMVPMYVNLAKKKTEKSSDLSRVFCAEDYLQKKRKYLASEACAKCHVRPTQV